MSLPPFRLGSSWYRGPASWLALLGGAPGVQVVDARAVGVHRTHLPLLTEPLASETLASFVANENMLLQERARRDAATAARGFTLRGYQHAVPAFAARRRGVLVADMPRLGKTAMSLAVHDPSRGPVFVVAPLSTRDVWLGWLRRYFPDEEPRVLTGWSFDSATLRDARVVFAHYDILHAWQSATFRIGTLILDEVHLLSGARGVRSPKRLKAAGFLATRSEQVLGLSGTPLSNRPVQLWSILELLCPRAFGSKFEFGQRYGAPEMTPHGWRYRGTSHEAELRARLTEVMLRRTWQEVQPELPETDRSAALVELTDADRLAVDHAAAALRIAGRRHIDIADLARYRQAVGAFKVPVAIETARTFLDAGEPVVVWTWHKKVATAVHKGLPGAYLVTGDTPVDQRSRMLAAWRADPEPKPLVITIAVGQVGIDLSHARHAIFAELDFTPYVIAQSEMRTFSPLRPMTVTYVVLDHDVDRRLAAALATKCAHGAILGVPAADAAVDCVQQAFGLDVADPGDLDRLRQAFLAGYQDIANDNDDWLYSAPLTRC